MYIYIYAWIPVAVLTYNAVRSCDNNVSVIYSISQSQLCSVILCSISLYILCMYVW